MKVNFAKDMFTDGAEKHDEYCKDPIYEILMICSDDNSEDGILAAKSASYMGFYYTYEDALRTMHTNNCDIREALYDCGFILKREPGLYNSVGKEDRWFFVWDDEKKGFYEAEEPEVISHISF